MKNDDNKQSMTSRVLSMALAAEMMVPAGGITKDNEKEYLEKQAMFDVIKQAYLLKIANLSDELYDKAYNDYCNNEKIEINDNMYPIKDLYIEYGYIGDKKIVYLKDYHNKDIDLITGKEIDSNYQREKVVLLKYSYVFYEYFHSEDIPVIEFLNKYDGKLNYEVPETYFYNPRFSTEDRIKEK